MERLLRKISALRRSAASETVRRRMEEFRAMRTADGKTLFKELCFCLLTANYTSEGGIRIQKAIGDGFISLGQAELASELKRLGYRFPNARARYIVRAREHDLSALLAPAPDERILRERVSDAVLGLGFKESSHFLRNIGHENLAIIDFHVLDLLVEYGLIKRPKSNSLSRKAYLEIETVLDEVARRSRMSQGELDLWLWYIETGKILK